ncbi:hypothetical protein P5G65_00015 [Paenibacillus chondroitinus]|uniref:Uncharacterized protein n=1 Tax=Paenibacillus chondroitinus TaxID=59842 RepID=A0ABU6D3F8_9BACL|nr:MULTISPECIES: hypothetical protein [Paenibacillus]MCY9660938.1 hypothetical protein [Paenibacillus anseongense]MEB4792264.1 hypothetical protein [Paenibacillus chondroitinus]
MAWLLVARQSYRAIWSLGARRAFDVAWLLDARQSSSGAAKNRPHGVGF